MQLNHPNPQRVPRAGASPPRTVPAQPAQPSTHTPPSPLPKKTKRAIRKPLIIGTVVAILLIAGLALQQLTSSQVNSSRYQAVFLSNGQAYFGKLHDYYTSRPYMTDVYYFQSNNQPAGTAQNTSGNQLLVKLGQEIHSPENKLILNKDSILFVENLSDDGKVVQAIKKDSQQSTPSKTTSSEGIIR